MLWSGSSPLAVVRDGMWGFLLFAGVAWLAVSWSVLRLEPTDIVQVAGPVVLFGALLEAVRALAGTRTWWLNAGMAVLFAVTGVILLTDSDSSYTTPAALVGWFLMVRGAADIAVSMMTRETDRIWGLLLVVGVAETGLGFFAASPFARTADLMVSVLGGLALARGVADLVAALRLREVPRASLLELPPERAAGVAGYSAGLTDYEAVPARSGPRHRAMQWTSSAQAMSELATPGGTATAVDDPTTWNAASDSDAAASWNVAEGADPGASWPAGGSAGAGTGWNAAGGAERGAGSSADGGGADLGTGWNSGAGRDAHASRSAAAGTSAGGASSAGGGSFHDEVLRTTADLDMMLALAGVSGAAVGVISAEPHDLPAVPDTPEGVELPEGARVDERDREPGLQIMEPKARAADSAEDDKSVSARGRLVD
jgi:uncharacterized membrane protein HdeD (DUF308 family)